MAFRYDYRNDYKNLSKNELRIELRRLKQLHLDTWSPTLQQDYFKRLVYVENKIQKLNK